MLCCGRDNHHAKYGPQIRLELRQWIYVGSVSGLVFRVSFYMANVPRQLFFFWIPMPLLITLNSIMELYKRYRRTLQPLRIVITSSVTLLLLGLCGGLWSPCVYPPWHGRTDRQAVAYCPFISDVSEGWEWIGGDVTPPHAYYVIPWLLLPAALL